MCWQLGDGLSVVRVTSHTCIGAVTTSLWLPWMKAAENVAAAAATHVADDLASCTRSAMADSDINADCWSSKLTLKRSRQVQFRSVDTGVSITAPCHKTSTKLYIWAYAHTGWPKNKPQTFVHIFAKYWPIFKLFHRHILSVENL